MPEAPRPAPDFGTLLGEYRRFRTGYPPEVFARVLGAAPREGPLDVLDLATGTGLSADGLRPRARRLVGIDIAAPMLRAAPLPHRALARAEALPFRDASFDLVACAQAFHWLDAPRALAEMHRVLRRPGLAAVWWKYEAAEDPVARLADRVVREVTGKADVHTPHARGGEVPGIAASPFRAEEQWVEHAVRYTAATYVGYHASREILRTSAGPLRGAVLERLAAELRGLHGEAPFDVRYRTRLLLLRA